MLDSGNGGVDCTQESICLRDRILDEQLRQGMGGGAAGQENNVYNSL